MKKNRSGHVYIYLTGGLGNQLFQYSHGKFLSALSGYDLKIDSYLGKPRLNKDGRPEIVNLIGYTSEFIQSRFEISLFRKISGFRLRNALKPKPFEKNHLIMFFITTLSEFAMSIYFKDFVKIYASSDIGFSDFTPSKRKGIFPIGYFQSYKYFAESNIKEVVKIRMKNFSFFEEFNLIAREVQPLIVHVRLGDYKVEKTFGLLQKSYYSDAIELALGKADFREIWLFSDEISHAREYIPSKYHHMIREVGDQRWSTSENLAIMSLGKGFIISNSTFSWWAAQLSDKPDLVVAPSPWFKLEKEPQNLIPENWIRLPAH